MRHKIPSFLYTDRHMDGHTEGCMDGQTDRQIPVYPKTFLLKGYKNPCTSLHSPDFSVTLTLPRQQKF